MVKQCVEPWKSDGGTVEECLWKSVVEQCDGTLEQCWWNIKTVIVELCGGTVEQ